MKFARGLDIPLAGTPGPEISAPPEVARVAILGSDYPDLRTEILVKPGDRVARGAPLVRDRRRPGVRIVAPAAGTVGEVTLGARRHLGLLTIEVEGDEAARFERPAELARASARALLLDAGLWPALTARPFGRIPDPEAEPDALFVVATDTRPGAPDPRVVVGTESDAFHEGIQLLRHVTDRPVFVCQPPGEVFVHPGGHVRVETVAGPHPAGLAGTLVDRLFPVAGGGSVWQIGYADVLTIGRLLLTGEVRPTRVVALAGPMARSPRLLPLPPGAAIDTLASDEARDGPRRVISGDPVGGVETPWLRRGHLQVTLLPRAEPVRPRSWLPEPRRALRPPAVIPHAGLDAAIGPRVPAMPLVRALSTGDAAEADRLGARALLPEDLALLTYVTGGSEDFGRRLADILERLEAGP